MNILDPQGPIAAAEKTILINSIAIMLAIVVPTIIAIFAFAFWFRQSNHARRLSARLGLFRPHRARGVVDPGADHHPARRRRLDRLASARSGASRSPGTGQGVTIQVVSLDWKWLFIYPDQRIATVNSLTVPVGAPLHFQLTSASVMNAFFIPQLGSMIYTMNGMVTQLELRADEVGTFQGLSGAFQRRRLSRHDVRRPRRVADRFRDWVAHCGEERQGAERRQLQESCASSRCRRTSRSTGSMIPNCSETSRPSRFRRARDRS